jgi:hypothetical protein
MPFRSSTRRNNLLSSLTPQPPVFPKLHELLGDATPAVPARPPERLFNALVGDPAVLWQDLLRHPERYENGLAELTQRLISGSANISTLSAQESALLDRAVLDLNYAGTRSDLARRSESLENVRRIFEPPEEEPGEDDAEEEPDEEDLELELEDDFEGIPLENIGPHLLQMEPDTPATENITTDSDPDSHQPYWWQKPSKP